MQIGGRFNAGRFASGRFQAGRFSGQSSASPPPGDVTPPSYEIAPAWNAQAKTLSFQTGEPVTLHLAIAPDVSPTNAELVAGAGSGILWAGSTLFAGDGAVLFDTAETVAPGSYTLITLIADADGNYGADGRSELAFVVSAPSLFSENFAVDTLGVLQWLNEQATDHEPAASFDFPNNGTRVGAQAVKVNSTGNDSIAVYTPVATVTPGQSYVLDLAVTGQRTASATPFLVAVEYWDSGTDTQVGATDYAALNVQTPSSAEAILVDRAGHALGVTPAGADQIRVRFKCGTWQDTHAIHRIYHFEIREA